MATITAPRRTLNEGKSLTGSTAWKLFFKYLSYFKNQQYGNGAKLQYYM
jgi:hypothetical protein